MRNMGRHDARVTSLCAAVDVMLRSVYNTLGAVIAIAFFLYALIAFITVAVVDDAAQSGRGRRRCRQLGWTPGDGQSVPVRPNAVTTMTPRCTATSSVSRAFSETKV